MLTQKQILAKKVSRLAISNSQKSRLLQELETLDESKLEEFSQLVAKHDEEARGIIEEKADRVKVLKDQLRSLDPQANAAPVTKERLQDMLKTLEEVFTAPTLLAQFVAASDDVLLGQIEDFLVQVLKNDPQHQKVFRKFFQEIRLQKAAFVRKEKEEEKQSMQREIEEKEQAIKALDGVIKEGKKLLKTEKKAT